MQLWKAIPPMLPVKTLPPSVNWYFKQSEVACGAQNYINNIVQLFTNLMKNTLEALMRDMLEYTPATSGSVHMVLYTAESL